MSKNIPLVRTDPFTAHAAKQWNWSPKILLPQVLEEIALHAEQNPDWLEISRG